MESVEVSDYPTCERTYATLRIYPESLDPADVTNRLGIEPSDWQRREESRPGNRPAKAVEITNAGGLASTKSITMRAVSGEEHDRITDHQLGTVREVDIKNVPGRDEVSLSEVGHGLVMTDDPLDFPFGYNAVAAEEEIPW